jgi:hypothetical protein
LNAGAFTVRVTPVGLLSGICVLTATTPVVSDDSAATFVQPAASWIAAQTSTAP